MQHLFEKLNQQVPRAIDKIECIEQETHIVTIKNISSADPNMHINASMGPINPHQLIDAHVQSAMLFYLTKTI